MADISLASLFFVSIFAVVVLIGCLVHNVMYVAKTAPSNGQSTVLWIIVVLFFGNIGFSIYLFVLKENLKAVLWLVLPILIFVAFFFMFALTMVFVA